MSHLWRRWLRFLEERFVAGAVGGFGVVDAAVDGVADDAFGVKMASDGVGLHAETD